MNRTENWEETSNPQISTMNLLAAFRFRLSSAAKTSQVLSDLLARFGSNLQSGGKSLCKLGWNRGPELLRLTDGAKNLDLALDVAGRDATAHESFSWKWGMQTTQRSAHGSTIQPTLVPSLWVLIDRFKSHEITVPSLHKRYLFWWCKGCYYTFILKIGNSWVGLNLSNLYW